MQMFVLLLLPSQLSVTWPSGSGSSSSFILIIFILFFPQRLCLNGSSGQEIIISTGLETVEALAFEPLSQLLYWVNAGIPKIEVQLCPPLAVNILLRSNKCLPRILCHFKQFHEQTQLSWVWFWV